MQLSCYKDIVKWLKAFSKPIPFAFYAHTETRASLSDESMNEWMIETSADSMITITSNNLFILYNLAQRLSR